MVKQVALNLPGVEKGQLRVQFAALCYRLQRGKIQVLVITSRRTKRWIMPKGWPISGKTPAETAAREAWEEAGVKGTASSRVLGVYTYEKHRSRSDELPCLAMLYPLEVKALAKKFPEAGERKRRWVSPKKAASLVAEPELARMLRDFDPKSKRQVA